jgi:hypothetical protein
MVLDEFFLYGEVLIRPERSLSETARLVGGALGGIPFHEDAAGTYDEFPSFSAKCMGISFVLLGIPEEGEDFRDPPVSAYVLQLSSDGKYLDVHQPCDASTYIADLLRATGAITVLAEDEPATGQPKLE